MRFSMTGRLAVDDRYATVTWDEGTMSGDADAVGEAKQLVSTQAQVAQTPTGPWRRAGLKDAATAWVTCASIFAGPIEATGDTPDLGYADEGDEPDEPVY